MTSLIAGGGEADDHSTSQQWTPHSHEPHHAHGRTSRPQKHRLETQEKVKLITSLYCTMVYIDLCIDLITLWHGGPALNQDTVHKSVHMIVPRDYITFTVTVCDVIMTSLYFSAAWISSSDRTRWTRSAGKTRPFFDEYRQWGLSTASESGREILRHTRQGPRLYLSSLQLR